MPDVSNEPTSDDRALVRALLGREPQGPYEIVVRDATGDPVVLRNAPFLDDGTPMPTRYWLIGPDEIRRIGRLESAGGVDAAEADVDPQELAFAHTRYAAERDAEIPADHVGPRPSGGVGGTRTGVKCLHAHWAWHLAGGNDPIGRWIERKLHTLHLHVDDDTTTAMLPGGATIVVPLGPRSLTDAWLTENDPPAPAALTNALGAFDDHLDDLDRAHGGLADVDTSFSGPMIASLARLELGLDEAPDELLLQRAAAEEIFRIVATEPASDRARNPGLPLADVDHIVATCCIVIATMRRFRLDHVQLQARARG
jgi:uncharacterized protein